MGQIEDLRIFVSIVESGGIARAADAFGIAKSAVSRRLAQLEERYDVRLIERQPGHWGVTTAGQELYQRACLVVADADDLDSDFMHSAQSLRGPLSVSIAREFGLSFLQPALFAFMDAHPQIDLTVDFDDRIVDLGNENYDLGVRITGQELTGLQCFEIGTICHGMFASASYAEKNGLPKTLGELNHHPLLHYGAARRVSWEFDANGKKQSIEFQPALNSNNGPFLLSAALRDKGIARLPNFFVTESVERGDLIQVMPEYEIAAFPVYVVYRTNKRLNKRMRAMIGALQESCAALNANGC